MMINRFSKNFIDWSSEIKKLGYTQTTTVVTAVEITPESMKNTMIKECVGEVVGDSLPKKVIRFGESPTVGNTNPK